MPNLKVVSTVSAGYDHLDIDYLKSRNIRIGHTPAQVADATADQGHGFRIFQKNSNSAKLHPKESYGSDVSWCT